MVIFHSYVSLPEGNHHQFIFLITHPFFMPMKFDGFLAPICPIQSPFNLHISPYISLYLHLCWSYPIFYPNFPTQITWFFQHEIPISPWHFHQEWGDFLRFPSDRIVGATSLQRGGPSRHGAANEASDDDEGWAFLGIQKYFIVGYPLGWL
jgi:hypothetical protein